MKQVDGGVLNVPSEGQAATLARALARRARASGLPEDEAAEIWAESAGVDHARLLRALAGEGRLEADELRRLRSAEGPVLASLTTRERTTMTGWDHRKTLACAGILGILVLAIIWWMYSRARKVPVCSAASWWPKSALGSKALQAGKDVIAYYSTGEGKGDRGPGFGDLPAYDYWHATTGRGLLEWIFSQATLEYLREGGVKTPSNLPPCVFDLAADCPACVELRVLWDEVKAHEQEF